MSDKKNIDKLFREKLGDAREVPYDEGAWQNMSALLDKNTPGNLSGGQQGLLATIGILLAFAFSFFTQNHTEPEHNIASGITPLEITTPQTPEVQSDNVLVIEDHNTNTTDEAILPEKSYNNPTEVEEAPTKTASENTNNTAETAVPVTKAPTNTITQSETPAVITAEEERIPREIIDLKTRDVKRTIFVPFSHLGIMYVYIPTLNPMENRNSKVNMPKSTLYLTSGMIVSRTFTGNAYSLRTAYAAPMGGFGYSEQLSHKWSMWGEMYYHERSGYGLENVQEVEGEGRLIYYEEEVESVRSGQNIHLLLGGRYNITKRHSIALGGYAGYLLQTTRARRTVVYADIIINEPHPDPVYGREGLSHWDAGFLLDYGFSMTPRWELGLRYQQGFIDQSNADFFQGAGRDISQQYGVLLRWKFRK